MSHENVTGGVAGDAERLSAPVVEFYPATVGSNAGSGSSTGETARQVV
jgi:hypothetical protein